MTQVNPRLKPDPAACVCGCGHIGRPKVKAFKDGLGPHARGCNCARCRGRNTKATSAKRELRKARKVGATRAPLSGALSGYDWRVPLTGGGYLFVEETTNQAITRGLERWWDGKGVQEKVARIASLPGVFALQTPGLTVLPTTDFEALVRCAREEEM